MLQVNRIKVVLDTEDGEYGFDERLLPGLNFIASEENTCGKSSILIAIYYCLGLEEIIGGQGEKVLTSAYKNEIKTKDTNLTVLSSGAYLELFNGADTITVYRAAKMEGRGDKLITVYYSPIDDIKNENIIVEDMYVQSKNAAVNRKGFHAFLEKYLGIELPLVSTTEPGERKLYLQLIFAALFIEQKRGWSDIFSGMPYLGIKDSKKRVVEFLLGLEVNRNEKRRNQLSLTEGEIKNSWKLLNSELLMNSYREGCEVVGIPANPIVLEDDFFQNVFVYKNQEHRELLDDYLLHLQEDYSELVTIKPRIIDNYDSLQNELTETEEAIKDMEKVEKDLTSYFYDENMSIKSLSDDLEVIKIDISNNKDAYKLKNLGTNLECLTAIDECPICHQRIQDSLLPIQSEYGVMSIEENIKHLNAQKEMLEFALEGHKQHKKELDMQIQDVRERVRGLRRLAKSIRSDLYSVNEDLSETVVYKKIELQQKIESLIKFKGYINEIVKKYKNLSEDWKDYLDKKDKLPTKSLSEGDSEKLAFLKKNFVTNLTEFGYKSVTNLQRVEISPETYLPITERFDMKFDSSASDNVRAIWAYTIALLQTSAMMGGNHPGILIFDEPDQHSIIMKDLKMFFDSIINLLGSHQVIIGITIKEQYIKKAIEEIDNHKYHIINIMDKAFTKFV